MDNYKLLEKYRKKLSIIFSLFILISIWLVVLFFNISTFLSDEQKDINLLKNKVNQIKNTIQNKNIYSKLKEITFEKVLEKVYNNSVIFSWKEQIVSRIKDFDEFDILEDKKVKIIWEYKYYRENYFFDWKNYILIVRKEVILPFYEFILNYLYFLLFTIPFGVLFYFFWYYFIWKNLKPLEENISNLEDFVWNINHEFKTPISEIISSLELSKKTKNYESFVNQSIISANKLDKVLNSLVWLVKLSNNQYKKENLDLVLICNNIIEKYKEKLNKKNIEINFKTGKKSIFKKIISEHFEICFWNLLSNSIKYNKTKWVIDIFLDDYYLIIKDSWIWIEKENLSKIFNRYFRESYVEDWSWIWLSIVKKIVDINNWKISINSDKNIWTEVIIKF